jgi:hypothetical protein
VFVDVMDVMSFAVLLTVFVSPPVATETEFVTLVGALDATFTVKLMAGYAALVASASARVAVKVPSVMLQPVPVIAVAVRPAGKTSTTLTVPVVASVPTFVTTIV